MTKAILVNFRKYQPYGGEFYEPMLTFFLQRMNEYKDEYDKIYLIDSLWNINPSTHHLPDNVVIHKVDPSLRYYDAYKEVLPKVTEDAVLLLDNDMVIYKERVIAGAFEKLGSCVNYWKPGYGANGCKKYGCVHEDNIDVVTIFDTIGDIGRKINEKFYDIMKGKNKFCPYFFCTRKDTLMRYLDVDWSPQMPEYETLGMLTYRMLEDGLKPFEMHEDKAEITMENDLILRRPLECKKTGYYHIRSGSTPTVLLAYRQYDPPKFWEYIRNQPKREYLRQLAWYQYMLQKSDGHVILNIKFVKTEMLHDMEVKNEDWARYYGQFLLYHGV